MKPDLISEGKRWKMDELFINLKQYPGNSATEDTAGIDVTQAMVPIWKSFFVYNTL